MPSPKIKYGTLVLSHWYSIIEGAHFSSDAFYKTIQAYFEERKLPGVKLTRIEYLEGGLTSDRRVYLRLSREQFSFDLCAAPFGKEFFFSLRFVERGKSWLRLLFSCFAVAFLLWFVAISTVNLEHMVGWLFGIVMAVTLVYVAYKARLTQQTSAADPRTLAELDASRGVLQTASLSDFISGIAIIGNWYDRIRRDTYYRHDTRLLYHQLVTDIVKRAVAEITAEKGVELRREWDYSPAFDDLYRMKTIEREPVGAA